MLLHAARFPGRVEGGALRLLAAQDRSAWDGVLLAEGMRALDRAATGAVESRFHLEAAIAAAHAAAPTWADTDWPHILSLYDALVARWPSPVAALNRADRAGRRCVGAEAALAEARGADHRPAAGPLPPAAGGARRPARPGGRPRCAPRRCSTRRCAHEMSEPERRLLAGRRDRLRTL